MQLGCSLPVADTGTGPAVLRDYIRRQKGWVTLTWWHPTTSSASIRAPITAAAASAANAYHDPFVLFGFLSGCTQRIGFAVGVLILAQR